MNDDLFGSGAADEPEKGRDHLFLWTVGILLLIGATLTVWLGAFYVFGHPEKPESYRLLQKFKKLPVPKRFELTKAPPGEFLTPQKAYERYGAMSRYDLERENEGLLRDYIRNYENTKRLVPYLTGRYTIMNAYGLKESDFVGSGVVALAQSVDVPQVVIEHLYPAPAATIPVLEQMLAAGLDLKMERASDLAAVIHIDRMPDGRLQFTVVPLIYGSYALAQGSGRFSLEPPPILNPGGGLPVVRGQLLEDCLRRYAESIRERNARITAQRMQSEIPVAEPAAETTLVQVATPTPSPTPAPAEPLAPTPSEVAVVAPTPAPTPEGATLTPAESPTPPATAAVVSPTPPVPARSPLLQPFLVSSPTPAADAGTASTPRWRTYPPGRMPRGRLVTLSDAGELADRGIGGERLYLRGDFIVTAAGNGRAVLRARNGGERAPRAIIAFPADSELPNERQGLARDQMRPFEITDVRRNANGQITIFGREVTTP